MCKGFAFNLSHIHCTSLFNKKSQTVHPVVYGGQMCGNTTSVVTNIDITVSFDQCYHSIKGWNTKILQRRCQIICIQCFQAFRVVWSDFLCDIKSLHISHFSHIWYTILYNLKQNECHQHRTILTAVNVGVLKVPKTSYSRKSPGLNKISIISDYIY